MQRFRNAGSGVVEKGERSFRFTITDFPQIHPLHCGMLTGNGQTTGKRSVKTFSTSHDHCVHRGDRDCSFLSEW
jgi:hypothetical protein